MYPFSPQYFHVTYVLYPPFDFGCFQERGEAEREKDRNIEKHRETEKHTHTKGLGGTYRKLPISFYVLASVTSKELIAHH